MEAATRTHFFSHGAKANPKCHFCQLRAFATHPEYPVTIVNTVDDAVIDPTFRFVDKSVNGRGVERATAEFRSGCDCESGFMCQFDSCFCLEETDEISDYEYNYVDLGGDRPVYSIKAFAYHSHGAKAGLLKSRILDSRVPIYECHDGCSCGPECPNRIVERGRRIPLQIFRTENRGWGVQSPVNIKKGQFIDGYLGEIITPKEADRRRAKSDIAQRKDVYLFALDKFSDDESPDLRLRGQPLEVDGEFMSGPTRFVNHSCEPNLRIFARVGDHADKHIHDLALFAIEDIPKGTELTFDYVDGVEDMDKDAQDPEKRKKMTECLCGTEKCRGYLW